VAPGSVGVKSISLLNHRRHSNHITTCRVIGKTRNLQFHSKFSSTRGTCLSKR
jgi:hypothetical protein